jgi:hypothetical protein
MPRPKTLTLAQWFNFQWMPDRHVPPKTRAYGPFQCALDDHLGGVRHEDLCQRHCLSSDRRPLSPDFRDASSDLGNLAATNFFEVMRAYAEHATWFGSGLTPRWPMIEATENRLAAFARAYRNAISRDRPVTQEELATPEEWREARRRTLLGRNRYGEP